MQQSRGDSTRLAVAPAPGIAVAAVVLAAAAVDANARCSSRAFIFCCRLLLPWRRSDIAIIAHIHLANIIAITFIALLQHPDSVVSVFPLMLHSIIVSNFAIPVANRSHIRCLQAVVTSQAG
jgi:hypothetical protein